MWDSVRRVGAGFLGVAALLAMSRPTAIGQQSAPPAPAPASAPAPAPAPNANVYVNPYAAAGRAPASAPTGRLGYGSLSPSAAPGAGYGSLAASYANPSLGYGSLTNNVNNSPYGNGGYGNYGGYGMYGTQWMMNPYQGYLSGAADVTRANAEYYQTIQQAKLLRQETIRSSLQTRRAFIEEAEWERAHQLDPEKIRQEGLRRELDRARSTPPYQDIWEARSLNALLRYLIAQQGLGVKGPNITLSEDILDHINLTVGNSNGNVGLLKGLKNNSELHWPLMLMRETFKEPRDSINDLLRRAYKSVENGSKPENATISDLRHSHDKLKKMLDANVDQLTPSEYSQATRYLSDVNKAIDALKSASVVHYFDGTWKTKARDVAGLVQFMREQGLQFAPATPRDESAYVSLYYSLAAFDRGMQRYAREGGESER